MCKRMVEKIYFDMDGVLADFDRGVRELCNMEPSPQTEGSLAGSDAQMWAQIRLQDHFYDRLQLMPGAKEMFERIYARYGTRCEILTGIPKPDKGIPTAAEDKVKWVRRLLSGDIVIHTVLKKEKALFCKGKDCILIDDLPSNIRAWEECGGLGSFIPARKRPLRRCRKWGFSENSFV